MKKITLFLVSLVFAGALWAQNVQISGVVTDATDGSPLPGVSVVVKGTRTSATTDVNGRYTISAPADAVLEFSFAGMATQEESVNGRTVIDVALVESAIQLEELVVTAFGTSTKQAFTGSAVAIGAKELSKRVTTNVANALAGQVAGVQLRSSDGAPGAGSTLRIRGFTSLYAGKDPLIIVDGAPYTGSLSTLNSADIETFTVLKDAASTSLYGARAANGVVMITTKSAKKQEAVITVDAKVGVKSYSAVQYDVIRDPKLYYETYYGALYNYFYNGQGQDAVTAAANANSTLIDRLRYNVYDTQGQPLIVNGKLNENAKLGRKVTHEGQDYLLLPDDWRDYAYKTGIRQEYNVTVSGGNEKATFYASAGYLDEDGIVEKSSFQRFTARLKGDYEAKKWLKVGGNFSFYNYKAEDPGDYTSGTGNSGNIFSVIHRLAPIYPLFIRDGKGNIMKDERGMDRYDYGDGKNAGLTRQYMSSSNVLSSILMDELSVNGSTFNINGYVDIKFTDKLKLQVNATSYMAESRTTEYTNPYYGQFASQNGIIYKNSNRYNDLNTQQLLTYKDNIGDHEFDVMLGHEYTLRKGYSLSASKSNMFSDLVYELNHAVNDRSAASSAAEYNVEGFFGRAQYDYNKKYFASASFRRDATSRFNSERWWGNFWSLGGAWLISDEEFFQDLGASWVDMLKFKASYGTNGNDEIGDFMYADIYGIEPGTPPGAVFSTKGNREITWETNANFNTGFEFEFFEKRLTGSIEYYNRTTYDLLFYRPAPESVGYSGYYDNIGDMRNHGFEVDLKGTIFSTEDFEWVLNANLSTVKNTMIKLPPERMVKENGFASGDKWISEGGSIYDWYLFKYAGVNEHGEALYYKKIEDDKGNHIGDETTTKSAEASQYTGLGTTIPDFFGGFGSSLYFKGFDLSFTFDFQVGGKVYDSAYASLMASPSSGGAGSAIHVDVLQAWSTNNTSSRIPRYQDSEANSQVAASDRFLVSGSYLNFQNINLGYTFPNKWVKKIGLSNLRLYCSVENIVYWSKRKGLDPRQSYDGTTTDTNYGGSRTVTGGMQLTF